jgi:hypothetical protein
VPHDENQNPFEEPQEPQEPLQPAEVTGATSAGETASTPPEDPYEGAVPPGYDWPTHGGYLGCLMAQLPACLVGGFLGSTLYNYLILARLLPGFVVGLLAVATFVVGMILFGRLGWLLGRRFYRAYEQPAPTWGESDAVAGETDAGEANAKSDGQQSTALRPETP